VRQYAGACCRWRAAVAERQRREAGVARRGGERLALCAEQMRGATQVMAFTEAAGGQQDGVRRKVSHQPAGRER